MSDGSTVVGDVLLKLLDPEKLDGPDPKASVRISFFFARDVEPYRFRVTPSQVAEMALTALGVMSPQDQARLYIESLAAVKAADVPGEASTNPATLVSLIAALRNARQREMEQPTDSSAVAVPGPPMMKTEADLTGSKNLLPVRRKPASPPE